MTNKTHGTDVMQVLGKLALHEIFTVEPDCRTVNRVGFYYAPKVDFLSISKGKMLVLRGEFAVFC